MTEPVPRLCLKPMRARKILDPWLLRDVEKQVGPAGVDMRVIAQEFEKGEAVQLFARKVCNTCMQCPHLKGHSEAYRDDMRGETVVMATLTCDKIGYGAGPESRKIRTLDHYCPDGFNVSTLKWVDPTSLDTGASWVEDAWTVSPVSASPVEADEPFDPELQNHKTGPDLARELQTLRHDLRARSGPGTSHAVLMAAAEAEAAARREMFFGSAKGLLPMKSTRPLTTAKMTSQKFEDEYMLQARDPGIYAYDEPVVSDVPQSPDTGTW